MFYDLILPLLPYIVAPIFFIVTLIRLQKRVKSTDESKKFNSNSVIAFIFALLGFPFGIIGFVGYKALKQIEQTEERGSGLAKYSIAVAWAVTSWIVSMIIVVPIFINPGLFS